MRLASLIAAALLTACAADHLTGAEAREAVPDHVSVGHGYVGDELQGTLDVSATGSGWLRIVAVSSRRDDVTVALPAGGTSAWLAPGSTLALVVRWRPAAAGALDTTVDVTTDLDGATSHAVQVDGVAQAVPDCDDGNPCTTDAFDHAAARCTHANRTGACDDGSACTEDDRCTDGVCRGRARACDDDDVCTLNLCDPASGCVFPADGRRCDDQDPCTKDVCDRAKGCSHPDADDGTACGAFSCAEARVCVFGRCHALDVTGASNDLPCFDGDLCTEHDTCQEGACAPGPRVHAAPAIVATLETWGGAGARMATDGFRYVTTDGAALRLLTRDASGELQVRSRLPLASAVTPVVLGPGRFLLAHDAQLTLVDAVDPALAHVAWEHEVTVEGTVGPLVVRHLARVTGGVVAAYDNGGALLAADSTLVFVPLAPDGSPPGAARALFTSTDVVDLDADGSRVVYATPVETLSFTVDATGTAGPPELLAGDLAPSATRVSVEGNRAALVIGPQIVVRTLGPVDRRPVPCGPGLFCREAGPGCDGSFTAPAGSYVACDPSHGCPSGTRCLDVQADPCPRCDRASDCAASCCGGDAPISLCLEVGSTSDAVVHPAPGAPATDVVLSDGFVYWSSAAGVFGASADARGLFGPLGPTPTLVDAMPADGLERGPGHLVSSGTVALPLLAQERFHDVAPGVPARPPSPPSFLRLTGAGQGDVSAVTDAALPSVLVAGPVAVGELDLVTRRFAHWALTATASSPQNPRLLAGRSRTVPVDTFAGDAPKRDDDPACFGVKPEVVDRTGQTSPLPVCGLQNGALEVANGRLWSESDDAPDIRNSMPQRRVRAWSLVPFSPVPTVDRASTSHFPGQSVLRASDADGSVALLTRSSDDPQATLHVTVYGPDDAVDPRVVDLAFGARPASRNDVGLDGTMLLAAGRQSVGLQPLTPPGTPQAPALALLPLPDASPNAPVAVPWMARGRAWTTWQHDGEMAVAMLSQLAYDPLAGTLSEAGQVALPEPLRRLYDTGLYAVATTPHAVLVISPACR